MKKTLLYMLALAGTLLAVSCKEEYGIQTPVNTPAIDVTTQKLEPAADEAGSVRAFIGTEVTAHGFNLEHVSKVTVDDADAEIVTKEFKTLVFKIPALSFAQNDDPYKVTLKVFDADGESVIFRYDYYVTVPVTDALVSGFSPKSGTVGTEVTIAGRNLSQVTAVTVGGQEATIAAQSDDAVKVAVPTIPTATAAKTGLDIVATWSQGNIDVTATDKFELNIPTFATYTQAGNAILGDEIALSGENLDLASGFKWGDIALLVVEQTATAVTLKIPTGIEVMTPAVQTKDVTAVYGTPAQTVTVVSAFVLDTSPIGPAAPIFSSIENADAAYGANFYLGKELVVKGSNFATVEGFKVDGITVPVSVESTDVEARFVVPSTISGTAAKEVTLVALWNGGNELDCGTITVCPFFYTKGLRIRIGSNSKNSYPAENREESFLLLDEARVVSVQEWNDIPVDPFAKSGSNTVISTANKVTGAEADYYSVQPYTFAISNSSNKLSFCDPANTANQLKTHYLNGTTALPATFGTPVMFFAVVTDETLKGAAASGALQDIVTGAPKASAGAPACGAAESTSVWVKGSVLAVQYVDYSYASTGTKPGEGLQGVRKAGYIHIADITCVDANGAAVASREGYIELDLYWSNVLN